MKTTDSIDAAQLELLLTDLRLPAVKLMWKKLADQSDKEGWLRHASSPRSPSTRWQSAAAAASSAISPKRVCRSALATFDFEAVPMVSKAQAMALAAGDS